MHARQLIEDSTHGPDTLAVLCEAFDTAWAELAPHYGSYPAAVEAARLKLAHLVLVMARHGHDDPVKIKITAVKAFGIA